MNAALLLALALSAFYFTGWAPRATPHRFTCAETGTAHYEDTDGNPRRVVLYACED